MASTKNPESKAINQKRGPTTGNAGTASKVSAFKSAKSESSSEKSKLADFVMKALETRGTGMKPSISATSEPLDANRGPKANPTANGSKLSSKYKSPKTKG